jgi:oligoribonuclease NrnB/cAMP/cGMP phosphodiesterase (DHH superfamily)
MDGSGCAILFRLLGGKKENIYFVSADHNATKEAAEGVMYGQNSIIFADCSIPVETAEKFAFRKDVILFDHHKTAIPLDGFDWCHIDKENSKCGSLMFKEWLAKKAREIYGAAGNLTVVSKYDQLISYIDDYDRWQHNFKESKDLNILHSFYGQSNFIQRFLRNPWCDDSLTERKIVEIQKDKEKDFICNKIRHTEFRKIDGLNFAIVEASSHQSQLGNEILNQFVDVDIVLMIGPHTCSLRSREGVDSSKIAKYNGGGGHAQASGFATHNVLGGTLIALIADNIQTKEQEGV